MSKNGTKAGRSRGRKNPKLVSLTSRKKPDNPQRGLTKSAEEKRLTAYAKLGVDPAEVAKLPLVSPILEAALPGGVKEAVGFLRTSEDKQVRDFLRVYDELSPDNRDRLPFEAFCAASSLPPVKALGLVVQSCYTVSRAASSIIASINQPKVVEASVRAAMYLDGHHDRKVLHTASGFLPTPKNNTNFFAPGAQQNNTQNNAKDNAAIIQQNQQNYSPGAVSSVEAKLAKITDRYNQRMGIVNTLEPVEEAEVEVIVEEVVVVEPIEEPETWD